jgi:hypothetical protein
MWKERARGNRTTQKMIYRVMNSEKATTCEENAHSPKNFEQYFMTSPIFSILVTAQAISGFSFFSIFFLVYLRYLGFWNVFIH